MVKIRIDDSSALTVGKSEKADFAHPGELDFTIPGRRGRFSVGPCVPL